MKVCACVAEYNPLHLGHLKHIEYMKNVLKADKIIVIMSGNFTQRGEPAVLNKYSRAETAILAGADMVIELPTVFATANAEIFAKGAVKILDELNIVDELCFGVESGSKKDYIDLATALNNESKEFKKILKEKLDTGISFAKAKAQTLKELNGDFDEKLTLLPNNILGVEYTRAILDRKSKIQICPMIRLGDHNDVTLKKGVTSATSIRETLKAGKVKKLKGNLPKYVYTRLKNYPFSLEQMIMASVITADTNFMADILDCTEGLENRIKALAKDNLNYNALIDKVSTKRYTTPRIKRILLSCLLSIDKKLVFDCLEDKLYAKVLAVKKDSLDLVSNISKVSNIPLLTRKSDFEKLKKTALKCFNKDVLASDLYNLATSDIQNEHRMLII